MTRRMVWLAGRLAFGVGSLLLAAGQPTRAGEAEGLLCQREEVAWVVAREVRARDYYATADFSTTIELPTEEGNVVHCTIGVVRQLDGYAWPWSRSPVALPFGYRVRLANRRFIVLFDRL
jgi:hypothetical protein